LQKLLIVECLLGDHQNEVLADLFPHA